jgi:hypothetical protein
LAEALLDALTHPIDLSRVKVSELNEELGVSLTVSERRGGDAVAERIVGHLHVPANDSRDRVERHHVGRRVFRRRRCHRESRRRGWCEEIRG